MKPIILYDNNQSSIYLSNNPTTKHIEIHHHLVQEKIEKGFVKLVYCNMEDMVMDILTKGYSINMHEYFWHLIGVIKCITW